MDTNNRPNNTDKNNAGFYTGVVVLAILLVILIVILTIIFGHLQSQKDTQEAIITLKAECEKLKGELEDNKGVFFEHKRAYIKKGEKIEELQYKLEVIIRELNSVLRGNKVKETDLKLAKDKLLDVKNAMNDEYALLYESENTSSVDFTRKFWSDSTLTILEKIKNCQDSKPQPRSPTEVDITGGKEVDENGQEVYRLKLVKGIRVNFVCKQTPIAGEYIKVCLFAPNGDPIVLLNSKYRDEDPYSTVDIPLRHKGEDSQIVRLKGLNKKGVYKLYRLSKSKLIDEQEIRIEFD